MYLHDHLEKLRYFYEIARLGSLKKASESLAITQPSLTKSVKILEETLEAKVFTRHARGVETTEKGKILLSFCHQIFAALADVEHRLSTPQDPMAGVLRVGTYDSIAIYFWPKFLKKLLIKYPKLKLEMSTGRSQQIQHRLENGELDLILIVNPKPGPQIVIEELKKDHFKFYISTQKDLAFQKSEQAPLILMPQALAAEQNLHQLLYTYQLHKRPLHQTSSLESVKELTLNGLGVGLLPELVARQALKAKKLKEYSPKGVPKQGLGEHGLGLAYHKSRRDSPLIKALINEIKKGPEL